MRQSPVPAPFDTPAFGDSASCRLAGKANAIQHNLDVLTRHVRPELPSIAEIRPAPVLVVDDKGMRVLGAPACEMRIFWDKAIVAMGDRKSTV